MLPDLATVGRQCTTCAAAVPAEDHYCRRCGYAQPGALGAGAGRPSVLLDTRPSVPAILAAGAAVAAVAILAVTVLLVRAVFFGPEDTVRGYFDALAEREADRAWSMLDGESARGPLLSSAALTDSGYQPPADVEIVSTDRDGGRVLVEVSFTVAGTAQQLLVGVVNERRGLLRRWEIDQGQFQLVLGDGESTAELSVAGVRLSPEQYASSLTGFPGSYQVTAAGSPLLELEPVTALAGGPPVELTYQLRPDARPEIERVVQDHLDGCLESRQLEPEGCQLEVFTFDDYDDVSWSLVRYPFLSYQVQPDGTVYVAGEGGLARVTGTATGLFSSDLDEEVELPVSGFAWASGGQIWFEPDL